MDRHPENGLPLYGWNVVAYNELGSDASICCALCGKKEINHVYTLRHPTMPDEQIDVGISCASHAATPEQCKASVLSYKAAKKRLKRGDHALKKILDSFYPSQYDDDCWYAYTPLGVVKIYQRGNSFRAYLNGRGGQRHQSYAEARLAVATHIVTTLKKLQMLEGNAALAG